jgi:NAD-dependent deacetylase
MTDAEFQMTPQLDSMIQQAAAFVRSARSVVALTGAGLSVESGIPPFRGPGGLWTKHGEPPLDGYQRFLRDPAKSWHERLHPTEGWALGLKETLEAAKPNLGHDAFVALEAAGCCDALITQNVDDLHLQAGQQNLLEIHGNHYWLRCLECHERFDPKTFAIDEENLPPHCPRCDGIVKGDTVSFGEPIPPAVLRGCYAAVERCDVMLVAGTSATVFPAADFPMEVLRKGGAIIEINPYESELTAVATLSLQGPGGAVLERLLHHVRATGTDGASA